MASYSVLNAVWRYSPHPNDLSSGFHVLSQFFFNLSTPVIMRAALEVTGEWISTVCRSISWHVWLIFPSVWKQVELHPWASHLGRLCLSSPSLFPPSLLQRRSADGLKVRESRPNGNLVAGCSAPLSRDAAWDVPAVRLPCRKWTALWKRCAQSCTWRLMMKWSNTVSPSLFPHVDGGSRLDCLCTMQSVHFE